MTTSSTTTAPPSPAPWHRADELARKKTFSKESKENNKHCYVYSPHHAHQHRRLKSTSTAHSRSASTSMAAPSCSISCTSTCRSGFSSSLPAAFFISVNIFVNIHSLLTCVHSCSSSPESSGSCSCTWASACACTQQHVHPHLHRFDYICTHWTFFTDYMLHAPCIMLLPLSDKQHVQLVHGLNTSRVSWNGVDDENGCSAPCPGTRGSKQPSRNLQIVLHFS